MGVNCHYETSQKEEGESCGIEDIDSAVSDGAWTIWPWKHVQTSQGRARCVPELEVSRVMRILDKCSAKLVSY